MNRAEIIASLLEQARDKDALAGGDPDSIFTSDAQSLREAASMLQTESPFEGIDLPERFTECPVCGSAESFTVEPTAHRQGGVWLRCDECGLHGVLFR